MLGADPARWTTGKILPPHAGQSCCCCACSRNLSDVVVKGWDEALRELKPESVPISRDASTVGDFLDELKAKADLQPKTLEGYAVALRKIVADAFKIDGGKEKFDYRKGGRQRWIERVPRSSSPRLRQTRSAMETSVSLASR